MAIVVTTLAVLTILGLSLAAFVRTNPPDRVVETRPRPSFRHQVRSRYQLEVLADEIEKGRAPRLLVDRDHWAEAPLDS